MKAKLLNKFENINKTDENATIIAIKNILSAVTVVKLK